MSARFIRFRSILINYSILQLNKFVEELLGEELLSCDSEIEKSIQQHQQSILENHSEKQDNRLPYQPPTLRKHGKFNNTTKSTVFP